MRKIKFRVPITEYDSGKFVRFLYETLDHGEFAFNEDMRDFPNTLIIGKEEQYIGLIDKYGYEIYEGDIMRHPDFNCSSFSSISIKNGCVYLGIWNCIRTKLGEGEIIGNIHENHELLK